MSSKIPWILLHISCLHFNFLLPRFCALRVCAWELCQEPEAQLEFSVAESCVERTLPKLIYPRRSLVAKKSVCGDNIVPGTKSFLHRVLGCETTKSAFEWWAARNKSGARPWWMHVTAAPSNWIGWESVSHTTIIPWGEISSSLSAANTQSRTTQKVIADRFFIYIA